MVDSKENYKCDLGVKWLKLIRVKIPHQNLKALYFFYENSSGTFNQSSLSSSTQWVPKSRLGPIEMRPKKIAWQAKCEVPFTFVKLKVQ